MKIKLDAKAMEDYGKLSIENKTTAAYINIAIDWIHQAEKHILKLEEEIKVKEKKMTKISAIPSKKNEAIEEMITDVTGIDRRKSIKSGNCSWCGEGITGFRGSLSQKEFIVSGLCQQCQDKLFGTDNDST